MNILLFGVTNIGKTTVGELLAKELGYAFYDLDEEVKARCHVTLEQFVNTGSLIERDRTRGDILGVILEKGGSKVIAVTPMYYSRNFSKYFKREDVLPVELQDAPEHILDRLVFSDENDRLYKDDEYRDAHRAYYLREIKKDITCYKKAFARILNKYQMDGDPPEAVVRGLIEQFGLEKVL
jgi:shikimate kinase